MAKCRAELFTHAPLQPFMDAFFGHVLARVSPICSAIHIVDLSSWFVLEPYIKLFATLAARGGTPPAVRITKVTRGLVIVFAVPSNSTGKYLFMCLCHAVPFAYIVYERVLSIKQSCLGFSFPTVLLLLAWNSANDCHPSPVAGSSLSLVLPQPTSQVPYCLLQGTSGSCSVGA